MWNLLKGSLGGGGHLGTQDQGQSHKTVNSGIIWKWLFGGICIMNMNTVSCRDKTLMLEAMLKFAKQHIMRQTG